MTCRIDWNGLKLFQPSENSCPSFKAQKGTGSWQVGKFGSKGGAAQRVSLRKMWSSTVLIKSMFCTSCTSAVAVYVMEIHVSLAVLPRGFFEFLVTNRSDLWIEQSAHVSHHSGSTLGTAAWAMHNLHLHNCSFAERSVNNNQIPQRIQSKHQKSQVSLNATKRIKSKSYATRKKVNSQSRGQGLRHRTTISMSLFARQILAAGPAQTITASEQ